MTHSKANSDKTTPQPWVAGTPAEPVSGDYIGLKAPFNGPKKTDQQTTFEAKSNASKAASRTDSKEQKKSPQGKLNNL